MRTPVWEGKKLAGMGEAGGEWLCDGCGEGWVAKTEGGDNRRRPPPRRGRKPRALERWCGGHYEKRHRFVPACVRVRPETVASLMLPASCAYRVLAEGRELAPWHPLLSGTSDSVHEARVSVRGWAISERVVREEDYEDFVIASE